MLSCEPTEFFTNSILLGFPYADVAEMGSSVVVVTDGDTPLADRMADDLAATMWNTRDQFRGEFTVAQRLCSSVKEARAAFACWTWEITSAGFGSGRN
ncbi:MAG: M81 family metallopeptidase [Planctomycetaceae bacterium]